MEQANAQRHGRSADTFTLLGLLGTIGVVVGLLIARGFDSTGLSSWEHWVFRFMLLYLVFITARTVTLIFLSFANRFFRRPPADDGDYPLVSVIVPCFNEMEVVRQAVESLKHLDYPNFEIIVVDDGSTDLTLLRAKELETVGKLRVIHQKNTGKAGALNLGISEALGEFFLGVDADSVLDSQVIRKGIPYFKQDPGLAAVAGSVHVGNDRNWLCRFQRLEYIVGLNFHKTAQSFLKTVTIVPGPVGLFRRSSVLAAGGYRSDTFAEDCELTIRLLMRGERIVYCDDMIAVTEAPEDYTSLLKQRYRWSRGTIQAIKMSARWLFRPWESPRNFAVLWYFVLETLVIPTCNFLFAAFFIRHAALSQNANILGPYFLHLTVLDLSLTVYSVFNERKLLSFAFLAVINRVTYGLSMEVLRFFSIIDELMGLPMNWNKLPRKGL